MESRDWSISSIIETLNLCGKIRADEYEIYNQLRKKRNDFIHEGKNITKDDAMIGLEMSSKIVLELLDELGKS